MKSIQLSVVIPAYNEVKNIQAGSLEKVYSYLTSSNYSFEIVVVNDGSQDETLQLLGHFAKNKKQVKIINNPHQGKGPTLVTGMLEACGKWRLFADMDQSTPIAEVEKLILEIQKGADIVLGSRMIAGAERQDNPFYRRVMGAGFSFLVNVLAVSNIHDTQCGFKLFTKETAELLFSNLYIYGKSKPETRAYTGAIDVELLFLAQKFDMTISEIPVVWIHKDSNRVNPVIDSTRMFVDVMRIRWADLTGKYSQNSDRRYASSMFTSVGNKIKRGWVREL